MASAGLLATVSGRVQGVFYRDFVLSQAVALGLTGYVRNLAGGERVEVWAEGGREGLEKLLEYLRIGPAAARVDKVAVSWRAGTGNFTSFQVRY